MLVVLEQLPALCTGDYSSMCAAVLPWLSPQQCQHIERHKKENDRWMRVLVRALLVRGVRELEGWDAAKTLSRLCVEPTGRPYVRDLGRPVSFSHAGSVAVCAIGPHGATGEGLVGIGVDIERITPLPLHELAQVFSEKELATIKAAQDSTDALFAHWTTKEALLKARGTGFLEESRKVCTLSSPSDGIYWQRLHAPAGYALTVAGPWPLQAVHMLAGRSI